MIVFLLPECDYDPTESAVPWSILRQAGIQVRFATPAGSVSYADTRLVDGGFSVLSPLLMTRPDALIAYRQMTSDPQFLSPMSYGDVRQAELSGLFVPGGHAPGMRSLLESPVAQSVFARCILAGKPTAAVCHGVLLAARARDFRTGRSVLYDRHTTAVTRTMETAAWAATAPWLGRYYRTYEKSVQSEVTAVLRSGRQFHTGPLVPRRDSSGAIENGFAVIDRNYISARWPGDCYRLAAEFLKLVAPSV